MGYEIINLGSDCPFKLMHVINLIENSLGKKAILEYHTRHPADVLATWADIGKAKRLLNWKPHTSIEEGIKRAVNWYLENREWLKDIKLSE